MGLSEREKALDGFVAVSRFAARRRQKPAIHRLNGDLEISGVESQYSECFAFCFALFEKVPFSRRKVD